MESFARRMAESGQNPADTLRRITFDSIRAARRQGMTTEQLIADDFAELAGRDDGQTSQAQESEVFANSEQVENTANQQDAGSRAVRPNGATASPLVEERDLRGSTAEMGAQVTNLRHLNVTSMDDVYALAEQTTEQFYADVHSFASELGGEAIFRTDAQGNKALKRRARAERKLPEYNGDAARVVDILGGTILFDTREQVEQAAAQIRKRIEAAGGEILRDKNRFAEPVNGGYRDYQFNFRYPNGFTVELQLNTRAMSQAKSDIGHDLYEAMEEARAILENEASSEAEKTEAKFVYLLLKEASEAYYGSTGNQSNETASLSVVEYPLQRISGTEADGVDVTSSSMYPKSVSLLRLIAQRLPSVAWANGLSWNSINRLTNTVPPSGNVSTRQGMGNEVIPNFAITARNSGEVSGVLDDGITNPPYENTVKQKNEQSNTLFEKNRKIIGSSTQILGKNSADTARYEVWELSNVIPSHDPQNGFARRSDYPAKAQERPYHSDPGEQQKVTGNALNYNPAFTVNTDPTAGNGPPIITSDGIVLGGNSRAMTLQLVYGTRPGSAQEYREALVEKAASFGLDPSLLQGMEQPILVRVVDSMDINDMAVKSRQYNQTTTQKLQGKAEGVSRARMIRPESLATLSTDMAEFDTLRQFLDSGKSRALVQSLISDGVIEQTEISSLTDKSGKLNDSGKKLVEDALRGMIVADYDVLDALAPAILNKLDRALPALARLKARGSDGHTLSWDMSVPLTAALRLAGKAHAQGRKLESWLGQTDLFEMQAVRDDGSRAVRPNGATASPLVEEQGAATLLFAPIAVRDLRGVTAEMGAQRLSRGSQATARTGEAWEALPPVSPRVQDGQSPNLHATGRVGRALYADKKRPAVQALALTFANATQKEVAARLELMADMSQRQTKGQGLLMKSVAEDNTVANAFIKSFLQPLLVVDGKAIQDFNPASNPVHAALNWAYENGGRSHSISYAMEKLHKVITSKKSKAADKAQAKERLSLLAPYNGNINIYPPKLGQYFSYKQGQELFQRAANPSEMEMVRKQYAGTNQWLKAPNGEPTNLTQDQWLMVRTPSFKRWFGDWEKASARAFLEGEAVTQIPDNTVPTFEKTAQIVDWAEGFFKDKLSGQLVSMPVIGETTLDRRSAKNSLSHGYGPEKVQALALLPDALPKSRLLASQDNKNGTRAYTFGAPVKIGEKDYALIAVVREDVNTKSVYVHECILKENIQRNLNTAASAKTDELTRSSAGSIRNIINEIFSVNSSKVIDANGEPLVVYHQTEEDFDTFDISKARQNMDIPAFYFSSGTEDWADMGGNTIAAFINMRNPKYGKPLAKGEGNRVRDELVKEGFDGTVETEEEMETEYAVFDPAQIKSATGNTGTFDPNNPNIYYQSTWHGGLEPRNSFGVPLSRVTVIDRPVSKEELDAALRELAERDLPNLIEGVSAQVNARQRGKLVSATAQEKSEQEGFSHKEHNTTAAKIENLWKWAALAGNEAHKSGEADTGINRYVSSISINGEEHFVWITTKKGRDGERIYSLELMKEEKLRSTLNAQAQKGSNIPIRSFSEIIERLSAEVNPQILNIHYQNTGQAIHIDSPPLVVSQGSDIRAYITAAKKYHDQLKYESEHGRPVIQKSMGKPVRFSRKGWRKLQSTGADPHKWQMFPHLRELLENAVLVSSKNTTGRKDGFTKAHWLTIPIILDGVQTSAGFTLLEDSKGNLFYNLTADVKQKESSPRVTRQQSQGQGEFNQAVNTADNLNIELFSDEVNPSAGQSSNPLGSTTVYPESYLVSLFEGANLSTLLHETGHIFFEEMERMVRAGVANEALVSDYVTLRDWVGAKTGERLNTAQREQLARGFEAYLMEGKAPGKELEGAFARFKKWLTVIYRTALNLKVNLTDEVRAVFGRMLATEEEMAVAAEAASLRALTEKELDALNIKGPARIYAKGLMNAAMEKAAEKLRKERDKNRLERRKEYARQAREILENNPVYQAKQTLRAEPLNLESVRDEFGEDLAKKLMRKVPGSLKHDGADPHIMAARLGFENAGVMLHNIAELQTVKAATEAYTAQKEAEFDKDFADEASAYLVETDEAAEQLELVGRYLSEATGSERIAQEAFVTFARRELVDLPMNRAISEARFLQAMRHALQRERRYLANGDIEAALQENHKARLNLALVREARELKRRREALSRRMKRFINMARGDAVARFMVMDIGMRHGLNKFVPKLAEGKNMSSIRDWLANMENDGYELFCDDKILYGSGIIWQEMKVADFESLEETVTQIITSEREKRKVDTLQGKKDLQEVADNIAASIYAHRSGKAQKLKSIEKDPALLRGLKRLHAAHTRIESLCIALDGDKLGPVWENIYLPISEAEDKQNLRLKKESEALKKLFAAYSRKELSQAVRDDGFPEYIKSWTEFITRKEFVPEVGQSLSKENRLALALNMGNEINISRIKEGFGWDDAQIEAVLKPLTKRDFEFVQSVWDYLETFKEESFDLQEKLTGIRPKAVEAKELSVHTAEGEDITLRGGYYPIKYNSDKSYVAYAREQKVQDAEFFGGRNYGAAMTNNGHLKERTKLGTGTPLLLELSVITDHVYNTVHDLCYRKPVLNVARLIRHKTVRQAFEETVGSQMYRELEPWLKDIAAERQEPGGFLGSAARWARSRSSLMSMGYKITTMVTQFIGYTQSVSLLGYKDALIGLKTVYGKPHRMGDLVKETFARSPMMQSRIKSFDREVRDFSRKIIQGSNFAWIDKIREHAFTPMGIMQMGVDLPTWWGAYNKAMRELGGKDSAVKRRFDKIKPAKLTGREIFNDKFPLPEKIADRRNALIAWLENKGWLKAFTNTDTGWEINVSKNSIRNTASHGMGENKAKVLAALSVMLKNGIYLEQGKTLDNGNKRHIFASRVTLDGEEFVVGYVVEEDKNGKRFYDHELTQVKSLDSQWLPPTGEHTTGHIEALPVLNIVRKHLTVKAGSVGRALSDSQQDAGSRAAGAQRLPRQSQATARSDTGRVGRALSDIETAAARYADSIVRQSQGSGSAKDLARVQRGGDLQKLFTMFYSYFNTLYNLGARRISLLKQQGASGAFGAANDLLLLIILPAVLSELIAGRGPDDDEDLIHIWKDCTRTDKFFFFAANIIHPPAASSKRRV